MKNIDKSLVPQYGEKTPAISFENGVKFAQRWISVEEELPEESGHYLVLRSNDQWTSTYFQVEKGEFVNYYSDLHHFTHWRPIEIK